MPIVVKVVPQAEFTAWLAEQKTKQAGGAASAELATPATAQAANDKSKS